MASKPVASLILQPLLRHSKIISPSILRPHPQLPRTLQPAARRFAHAIPRPPNHPKTPSEQQRARKLSEPHYQLTFTCVPCDTRSDHIVSKIGYHHGSVLITCPGCRNRHIISDHLNIFGDRKITVEDLMREKGQLVKRGTLGEQGDIEFWSDEAEFNDKPTSDGVQDGDTGATSKPEAARSRQTRNPSSRSTDPKPTASASLGDAGSRPSIRGSQPANPAPSTRRQYSTNTQQNVDKPSRSRSNFRTIARDADLREGLYQLSQCFLTDSRNRLLKKEYRRVLNSRCSALSRISKKAMLSEPKLLQERQRNEMGVGFLTTPRRNHRIQENQPSARCSSKTDMPACVCTLSPPLTAGRNTFGPVPDVSNTGGDRHHGQEN
ncbi:DNL zinc finger-domain-containing protein [Rostrohypoxylon terebratum]|nr:DNL zinc finger-domain-containing protein [Rostrohypoxylon terebratum]